MTKQDHLDTTKRAEATLEAAASAPFATHAATHVRRVLFSSKAHRSHHESMTAPRLLRGAAWLLVPMLLAACSCSRQPTAASSTLDNTFLVQDESNGTIVRETSFDLAACNVGVGEGDYCTMVRRSTVHATNDECNQLKSMVATQRLDRYALDGSPNATGFDAGTSDAATWHAPLSGDASTSSSGTPNNSAPTSSSCGPDSGLHTLSSTSGPAFRVSYWDSNGQLHSYWFWQDGRSFATETDELINFIRSVHTKYWQQ